MSKLDEIAARAVECPHAEANQRAAQTLRVMAGNWAINATEILAILNTTNHHTTTWTSRNLHDRVQETLNAKIEGDGHLPERGMFNCHDIQQLLNEAHP